MRKVLTLVSLLAVVHFVAGQCNAPTYTEKLIPACSQNDLVVKWPNYENQSSFYFCSAINRPVEVACNTGQAFSFVYQKCGPCSDYFPPVPCSQLRTQNKPNCIPINPTSGSSISYPTPLYPGTSTNTKPSTNATTIATGPTPPSVIEPPSWQTPPSPGGNPGGNPGGSPGGSPGDSSSLIPPPPSPVVNDPDIPLPPTPGPTPPSVNLEPPSNLLPQNSG